MKTTKVKAHYRKGKKVAAHSRTMRKRKMMKGSDMVAMKKKLEVLIQKYGNKHPKVLEMKNKLAEYKNEMKAGIDGKTVTAKEMKMKKEMKRKKYSRGMRKPLNAEETLVKEAKGKRRRKKNTKMKEEIGIGGKSFKVPKKLKGLQKSGGRGGFSNRS